MTFSPDLVARVRVALQRFGFCFLSADELNRLLDFLPNCRSTRQRALQEFAAYCGAEVETTPHLTSARFVPLHSTHPESRFASKEDFNTAGSR